MLSPRYLEGISDEIVDIYAQLEADILQDMARRIARLGKITEATKWQAQLLAETGALKKDVNRIIKKYDPQIRRELNAIYNDALIKSARADNRIFIEVLGHGVSDINAQVMLSSIQKTHSDLSRLTLTTAYTTETMFVQQANAAYMQVVTGAVSYDQAMKTACDNLAKDGITGVQYRNGKPVRLQIEPAVRMNILTGVNQTAAAMTLNNCDELECDLVETTAHIGARPEHEVWQGQVFSLSGNNPKYKPFSICGLGEITGICGINCRHSYYPYFEGMEKHYTQDELDDMAKETVNYNGEKMSRYEGEEKLRGMERNIRAYKRRALTQEAAGIDSTKAREKIGEWQAKARDFTKQTGIERDRAREFIGTMNGQQPKALNPSTVDYEKNYKMAHEIKRLDNSRTKKIAGVTPAEPMNFDKADHLRPNPNFNKGGGYRTNCQSCVVTYEMRRRGYNVQTLPNNAGSMLKVLSRDTSLAWVDRTTGKAPAYIRPSQPNIKKTFTYLQNTLKSNNRYTIEFAWKGSGAHIVHIYKDKNILHIYDPQCGKLYKADEVLEYLKNTRSSTIQLMDIQNCDVNLNVLNKIMEAAK